jgi:hypothetical protein
MLQVDARQSWASKAIEEYGVADIEMLVGGHFEEHNRDPSGRTNSRVHTWRTWRKIHPTGVLAAKYFLVSPRDDVKHSV